MLIVRSTHDILNQPWKLDFSSYTRPTNTKIPPGWNQDREMVVNDVSFWEQIYYAPGSLGIYVSWSPYTEFYMIVYNLFSHLDQGIQTFSGPDAAEQVSRQAAIFGIELPSKNIWINSAPSN
jgi:hypothetical protein